MNQVPRPRTVAGMPLVAALCAIAAAYPMIALVGLIFSGMTIPGVDAHLALIDYAAVMLTFMGAVHWGLAMQLPPLNPEPRFGAWRDWRAYTASMAPGFAAWIAMLLPARAGTWLLIVMFALLVAYDAWAAGRAEAPHWLVRMRVALAILAVAGLIVGVVK